MRLSSVPVALICLCASCQGSPHPNADAQGGCSGFHVRTLDSTTALSAAELCAFASRAVQALRDTVRSALSVPLESLYLDTTVSVHFEPIRVWPGGPASTSLGADRVVVVEFLTHTDRRNPIVAIDRADTSTFVGWVHK